MGRIEFVVFTGRRGLIMDCKGQRLYVFFLIIVCSQDFKV